MPTTGNSFNDIDDLRARLARLEKAAARPRGRTNLPGAARYLGVSEETLRRRHLSGDGPPRTKVGSRNWVYAYDDLDRWVATQSGATQLKATPGSAEAGRSLAKVGKSERPFLARRCGCRKRPPIERLRRCCNFAWTCPPLPAPASQAGLSRQNGSCPRCGGLSLVVGSSRGPHSAELRCGGCDRFAGWMPAERDRRFTTGLSSYLPGEC